jgi:tRNA 5-methylaminomethyl-2-thiouridine biosynthesis bifunctional protein
MPDPVLPPARLAFGPGGVPRSEPYDDIYHAADGGPGQACHVFLAGNGLPERWAGRERFVILENGFGTGLNFLATWAAWRADPGRPRRLHYLAVEKHPLDRDDLARVHAAWPEFQFIADALRQAWPVLTPGFHRLEFAAGGVTLTLMLGEAAECLKRLRASVDAFYLDGFDPKKNPDMWSPALFRRCAQLAAPDASLATWCVAAAVRNALAEAGFETAKRPGFARKKDMLAGRLAVPRGVAAATPAERRAVVLGAGLAGCAIARRLAARDWRVEVLDSHPAPAGEASGNLAGIVRPLLSRDDNLASRLNRACFLHTGRTIAALDRAGLPPRRRLDGVLQIARDTAHEALQRQLAARYPADYVRFLEREEAGRALGAATALGGWFFPGGGWVNPPSFCRALLQAGGMDLAFRGGVHADRLERVGDGWQVLPDRLPLVGALADPGRPVDREMRLAGVSRQTGLFGLLGLGSRGLVWAALAAEALASQLEGDPHAPGGRPARRGGSGPLPAGAVGAVQAVKSGSPPIPLPGRVAATAVEQHRQAQAEDQGPVRVAAAQ